jgi:hypothetical protein
MWYISMGLEIMDRTTGQGNNAQSKCDTDREKGWRCQGEIEKILEGITGYSPQSTYASERGLVARPGSTGERRKLA